MKLLFLDIDGVLNCDSTKERVGFGRFKHFRGLDQRLLKLFLNWLRGKPVQVVLSSTWRLDQDQLTVMAFSGLRWIGVTPNLGHRGKEIDAYLASIGSPILDSGPVREYAILDDIMQFHPWQMSYFVQTSPIHGLRPKNLKKLEAILKLDPLSSNGRTADFESAN